MARPVAKLDVERWLQRVTGARLVRYAEQIQVLWSGYGEIARFELTDASGPRSVVVKCVTPPGGRRHPRGWGGDRSHQRKLRSYDVEHRFYSDFAPSLPDACRVPRLLYSERLPDGWVFAQEDLDAAGYPRRCHGLDDAQLKSCLAWLARFHAHFLGHDTEGLWKVGTYWHLATRPDELLAMNDQSLRKAASKIDARLNQARFRTLVHGDAKVANFCFPAAPGPVAALDFQYVGGGCGLKDVAYFFSSCLGEQECEAQADDYLGYYFEQLRPLVKEDADQLEQEWRALYPLVWADFCRFLDGWAPTHHKLHGYSRRLTELALTRL